MGMMKAAQLAPEAVLLPADFHAYRHYSRLFKQAVADIAPCIEDRGIDEIYIDLTMLQAPSEVLGAQLKSAVHAATGLTCSIAIAPNKLLAKIGSELDKPDGLTILTEGDIRTRIWPLPVKRINGIGPKSNEKLAALGIETIEQLAQADPAVLQVHFGLTYARWLTEVAQGLDDRPVVTQRQPKSVSRETTFERDLHVVRDREILSKTFRRLCEQVAQDLARKQCLGRTIGVKLRFDDFRTVTRDLTLSHDTADANEIHAAARQCLKRVNFDARLRLLGVRVGTLVDESHRVALPLAVGEQLKLY